MYATTINAFPWVSWSTKIQSKFSEDIDCKAKFNKIFSVSVISNNKPFFMRRIRFIDIEPSELDGRRVG
jgi:hypothetical protein